MLHSLMNDSHTYTVYLLFQKVEKFRAICSELENQIKDLEAIQAENESKEAEWEALRLVLMALSLLHTYFAYP